MSKPIHILYVDDDPVMLQLFGGQLAKKGFEMLYAHDGAEGWEMVRKIKPELVLLDYRMPGMDGMETATHIKEDAETKDTPIIMLTSEDFSPDAVRALKEIGITEYVHKGQLFDELFKKVKEVLLAKGVEYVEPEKPY